MKTFVEVAPGSTTPSGLLLPERSKPVKMQVEIAYQTEKLWQGSLSFNRPQNVEKRVPRKVKYRAELVFLITKFLDFHKMDTRTNSSLTMLVQTGDEYILLNVGKTAKKNELFCQVTYNISEATIQRLKQENKVYPNCDLP